MPCPSGFTERKAYTRKGTRFPKSCIRKTSPYNQTSADFKKSTLKRMSSRLSSFKKTRRRNNIKCPEGYIVRKSYVRIVTKTGKRVYVPASCIPDIGNPGKRIQPGIGPLRKGELARFGYISVKNMSENDRHKALDKAIKELGSLSVWRKLNAVYVYNKNTNPLISDIYNEDRNWVKETYGIKAF
jgi:hypothetical protein